MKRIGICLASSLALVLSGCVEEQLEQKVVTPPTVNEGEVAFGAVVNEDTSDTPQTRTIYGEPGDYQNYPSLKINWLANQDQVRVYSPQASEECKSADYTVMSTGENTGYYLQKNGEVGVRWGDVSQPHEFYAFYPLTVDDATGGMSSISGLTENTVVSATIPVAQERGNIQTKTNGGVIWKIVAPNMTYAMMAGHGTWSPTTQSGDQSPRNVSLTFEPIVLVLDVVVNAGDTKYDLLGVSVRSDSQPIVGSFNYDVANGGFEYTSPGSDSNRLAWVDCQENGEALELNSGEKLNVKFFLLPQDIKASELTVSVLLENGQTLSQRLAPANSQDPATLVHGKIIKVRTPKIKPAQTSNWMSMIDNDVLFASQLSLPGTKHSYTYQLYNNERGSYNANSGIMRSFQTLTIDQQFDAGVRAFDVKLAGQNANIYVGTQSTNMTIGDMLSSLKTKLDDAPSEFVVVGINYVDAGMSNAEWLNAVCNAIDTWSRANTRYDVSLYPRYDEEGNLLDDRTDMNDADADYFREVVSTTTVGAMRHGIGIMIHYPDANVPSNISNNVNVISGYNTSVQNTGLVEYNITSGLGSGHITIQDLQQLNSPSGVASGLGIYPYFITEQYALGTASDMNLIQTKQNLIRELFDESRTNNAGSGTQRTANLYVNDLGGFCVVNNNESTGFVNWEYYTYRSHVIGGYYWDTPVLVWDQRSGTVTDYADLPTGYDYYNKHDDTPDATSGSWCRIDDENAQLGQGGNNALAAEQINGYAANLIYNLVNEGRTPLGVVYMNFAGVDRVSFDREYNVNGVRLPSLIMSNNFKFALATSSNRSNASGYDSEGSAIQ